MRGWSRRQGKVYHVGILRASLARLADGVSPAELIPATSMPQAVWFQTGLPCLLSHRRPWRSETPEAFDSRARDTVTWPGTECSARRLVAGQWPCFFGRSFHAPEQQIPHACLVSRHFFNCTNTLDISIQDAGACGCHEYVWHLSTAAIVT